MKLTGADWKAFYGDPDYWPEDGSRYHDDVLVLVNGEVNEDALRAPENIGGTDIVSIQSGDVFNTDTGQRICSLESHFKRWKRAQSNVALLVHCDPENAEAIMAAVKAAGGKVMVQPASPAA